VAHRFVIADVFTDRAFGGNQLAVIPDARGISDRAMQALAREFNFSETTFVLPPRQQGHAYQLRIFTPATELAFAGHPTIGSAHAALESGFAPRKDRLTQECLAGVLPLEVQDGKIFVNGPPAKISAVSADFGVKLTEAPLRVDVGVAWIIGEVRDAATLAGLEPDMELMKKLGRELNASGLAAFAPSNDKETAIHVRAFAPVFGIGEDPVTGSANLAIPSYLREKNSLQRFGQRYVARQGMQLGRDGRVSVRVEADGIWIGGNSVTCVEGTLSP